MTKQKAGVLEKINKTDKSLARITKRKEKKNYKIITDPKEMKRIKVNILQILQREHKGVKYKFNNLVEMDIILEWYRL